MFTYGGFPEPLLKQDETELRRWHLQRVSKLVRIDLRWVQILDYQVHMGTKSRVVDSNYSILPFGKFCEEVKLV